MSMLNAVGLTVYPCLAVSSSIRHFTDRSTVYDTVIGTPLCRACGAGLYSTLLMFYQFAFGFDFYFIFGIHKIIQFLNPQLERCCGFSVVMPLQARVTLEIVHFDGRAVGGAPEGCARCLMCRCEHILNAKSSRDAFVAQIRHEGHFCGCLMHQRATQGSCIAQDGAF